MKFIYEAKLLEVEAYGKTFILPKKTTALLTAVQTAGAKISAATTPAEQTNALLNGISAIIGVEETAAIFPLIDDVDCDEISAFWLALNAEYNRQADEVAEKYSPNRAQRRS